MSYRSHTRNSGMVRNTARRLPSLSPDDLGAAVYERFRRDTDTLLLAVTDPQGRVDGVESLRVVDASIFPVIPRANPSIPAVMVAEKIAAEMGRAA